MKKSDKLTAGLGLAAGAAAAVLPITAGIILGEDPPAEAPAKAGKDLKILAVRNFSLDSVQRETLTKRFGAYGTSELSRTYSAGFFTEDDAKAIADCGFNCVDFSINQAMFYQSRIKGKPDFEKLDALVEMCRIYGLYVVFNIPEVRSFAKKEKHEKALLKAIKAVGAHFSGNNSVAAIDISSPYMFKKSLTENKDFSKYCKAAIKAVKKSGFDGFVLCPVCGIKRDDGVLFVGEDENADVFLQPYPDASPVRGRSSYIFESFKSDFPAMFTIESSFPDTVNTGYKDLTKQFAGYGRAFSADEALVSAFAGGEKPKSHENKKKNFRFGIQFRNGKNEYKFNI